MATYAFDVLIFNMINNAITTELKREREREKNERRDEISRMMNRVISMKAVLLLAVGSSRAGFFHFSFRFFFSLTVLLLEKITGCSR